LPSSLQVIILGLEFDKKIDCCVALPKLKKLKVSEYYKGKIPIIFNTTIEIGGYGSKPREKIHLSEEICIKYDKIKWRDVFYESIMIIN